LQITICRNDECVLEDNSQRTKWKVISPTGNEAMVPSVCFLIPPPNKEAIEMANRVEQLYQKVMALWHQLHMNTKSLISWNYLRKDIALVQSFSMEKLRSLAQGECQQALKSLQGHYEDFLQDSRDSELFSVSDRLRLEEEVESSKEHIRQLLESMENEDKDETVARTYLSELKNVRLRLEQCEQRLLSRVQSPSSARADGDTIQENAIRMAEQERTQEDLQQLQSELRVLSERCCSFLDKAPAGPSTPQLRSELDLVVNKMEQTHGLSSIYLEKLKTVDVIIRNTQGAESLVKGYEVKLSQEEAVPADLAAIQTHRAALQQWLGEVKDKGSVFSTLEEEMAKAKEVGEQLFRLRQERSIDLERFQEKGSQLWERWQRVCAQIETRHTELESIQEVLSDYRQCHSALIQWIEEITAQQELMKPGQAEDSRVLSEQLSQQTALAAEIEKNQAKLDQCQKFSQQYSAAVKDYELQLMTYRAFVESQQKSPMKRRRMLSSSDAITQEFMDLRTRYTALVTLTTQHVKYISDALRRLEEEEKVVEEEKQEHVDKVKELLGWALGLKQSVQGRTAAAGSRELGDIEKSISEQQALNEELTAKKEQVSEAIKTSQIFLAKHSHKLSQPEKDQISSQIGALKETYQALCSNSSEQLQQLQSQLAQETEHKGSEAVAGVIDLGTVEIFPVFGAMQRGLIDQDTGLALLEAQVITSDLVVPETSEKLSLEKALARNIIDPRAFQVLQELKDALQQVQEVRCEGRQLLPIVAAIEEGRISENIGLKILEAELATGGFKFQQGRISMETAVQEKLLPPQLHSRLLSHLESAKDLIDPNTAEKISLPELLERCIIHQETGLRLLPVRQLAGGMVSLGSGREVSVFRAVQEGLIDRQVTLRLLECQLCAGGIVDPRTGHRLSVDEAVRQDLLEQDLGCTLLIRQLRTGGIVDTATGQRLTMDEALRKGLVAPKTALLVLESLQSFRGLLWPETGEIIPVADALEQGILPTELIQEILSKRQLLGAVFIPETTEVLSWQQAVEQGILEREVVRKLSSTSIPDAMASVQLPGSPSRHSLSSSGRSPPGQEEPLLSSEDERLMFHLMAHSYINIHDGHKVLLVDAELNNLTKALIQSQENGSCAQEMEGFEETEEPTALESEPCNGLALQRLELQFAPSKGESEKVLPPRSALENGEVVVGAESLLLEDAEDFLQIEEQEQVSTEQETTRSETGADFGREQITFTTMDKHQEKLLMPEPPSDLDSGLIRETEEMMIEAEESKPAAEDGVEGPEYQKRALESGAGVVKSEICITMGVPESRDRLKIVAEGSQGVRRPQGEAEDVREGYLLKEETVENGVLGGEELMLPAGGEAERQSRDVGTVLEVEEGEQEEVLRSEKLGDEEPSLPAPEEQGAEDTLEKLLQQLQRGGITQEQTGRTLLLDQAVTAGAVSGHTAVKLMERMKMFSGFFDSQVCEPLTTEDVIEEGLMDEKLLQKVLESDKAISGVLDPGNNFVYSIKDAAAVGLLDRETAMRILEGQVVTGGIVDLKRGKKVSVTLASNLGLIEPTCQAELVKLEKASKGKGTDEETRQKLINLQAETSGIVDPESKQPLTVAESVEKGLLEKEKAFQLLAKQVADGGIIHHVSGMRLSVDNAMKHGLVSADLCKELRKAESVVLQEFVHPATKEKLPLAQAVSLGLLSPEFQRKVQEIQAESGSILDPASGQRLALSQAVQEGLVPQQVVEKALSSPEMRQGIVDPESCTILPYSEFLKKCKIDIESGQRYLEVHPFQAIRDEVTGTKLPCAEAVRLGKLDPLPTLRLLQAQADAGGVVEGTVSKRLSLRAAVEQGMLDETMAKVIATNQLRAGGIVDGPSGKRLTVKEAVGKGLISQKLAAGLRDVQVSEEKVGSEVCKVEKIQLSQEKMEKFSPKEEGVILPARSDGAEPKAQPEAVSYDTATEKPPKAHRERKFKPQEASEGGAHPQDELHHLHHPQAKAGVAPEHPSVLGTASLPEEKGIPKSSQVRAAQRKELREKVEGGTEKVEGLSLEKEELFLGTGMLHREENGEERRKRRGFEDAEGVVAGGEGAVVTSGRGERVTRVVQETPALRESVSEGPGKGGMGPAEPIGVPVEPAGDELAGKRAVKHTERETSHTGAPIDQGKTRETELKPGQKQKSKKKKAKQGSIPGESAQPEKPPAEKQLLPSLFSHEISRKKAKHEGGEGKKIPGKETPGEDQVFPVPAEAAEVLKGGIKDGEDSLEKERMAQEDTRVETTQDVSSTTTVAQELPHDLIIREEPTETSPILELGEEKQHKQRAELRADQGSPAPPKSQEETPQERSKQQAGDRGLLLPVIVEGELLETSRESTRPAQIKFSKKMCLEHDQRLISYLSMLRDIEMRIKRVQPAEQNLAALHDLRQQAEALGSELQELSFPVNQELDAVQRIVANPPEEVPEQLLKALEKDAKNLQKSLSSASEILQSRLQNLRGAAEAEKAKILAHHEALQGRLQELLSWVSGTSGALDDSDLQQATDASSLSHCLQHYRELKEPLAATKAELDAAAFDVQFLISEHAQDLTPQQSRQLLRLLNELQKSFRDLSERVTARLEVLQVCLQQVEQTEQVKLTLQEQQAARAQSLAELSRWLGQAEDTLAQQQRAGGDLPALQQRQNHVKVSDISNFGGQRERGFTPEPHGIVHTGAAEEHPQQSRLLRRWKLLGFCFFFLPSADFCLPPPCSSLLNMQELGHSYLEPLCFQVKAAKELEENSNKIDSLLSWVASLEQKGGLPEYRPHPADQETAKSPGDVPDGHEVGADSAAESLDEQYERLKAQHQELLSQQQDVILATQSAQALLDKQGHSLAGEQRAQLQAQLAELREQYPAALARSEARLKRVQLLRDELQKFLRDHSEFQAWLEQAEQDLEGMYKGGSEPDSLRQLLKRQGSFSEDVISHKGDLRFVTMSGQKFLDGDAEDAESQLVMSRSVVRSKLEDATQRYTTLHSKCSKLGSHLNTLLDHYQQFQEVAESLRTWLQESEAALGELLSETVPSDVAVLQQQLASIKQLQGDLAEHQVPVEKLQKAARTLLDIQGQPAPDHGHIQETTGAIVSRFQSLSQQMSERSDLLQKSLAQSQSVQESLESLLQSVADIERSLQKDQPAVLSSASIQDSLATSVKLKQDIARQRSCLEATREMVTRFTAAADSPAASALQDKLAQVTEHFGRLCQQQQEREDTLKGLLPKVEQYEQLWERLQQFTESRTRMLASGNQPERDIAHFSQHIQELNSEMRQHQEDLATLEQLAEELSSCGFTPSTFQQQEKLQSLKKEFLQLQKVAKDREKDASSCQEQLDEFRNLVGAVRKWLRESEGKIPPAETSLGTQELQQRRQQIQDLLEEWKGKGPQVEEIGRRGTLLETLIVEITAPNTPPKAGELWPAP
ncbi:MACF1 factor, partial [Catharus fuscescens]|nr:MACF1 factor [Catharus fuscescens]